MEVTMSSGQPCENAKIKDLSLRNQKNNRQTSLKWGNRLQGKYLDVPQNLYMIKNNQPNRI
jgi:hypothetical protein